MKVFLDNFELVIASCREVLESEVDLLLVQKSMSTVHKGQIQKRIVSAEIRYLLSNSDMQGGRGFFLCPRGQRVGSAPNVHDR